MKRSTIAAMTMALLAVSSIVAPGVSWASQPTVAVSDPHNPSTPLHYGTPAPSRGGASTDSLSCYGEAAPDPQYSASNSTVHWGAKTFCNHVDTLWIRVKIWTVVGTGDRERLEYQGYGENSGVGTELIASGVGKCVVKTTGRWIESAEATAVLLGGELPPYPAWGPVKTLGCSDIA